MKLLNAGLFPQTGRGLWIGLVILGSVASARAAVYDLSTPQKAMDVCGKAMFDGDEAALRAAGLFPPGTEKLIKDFVARGQTLATARQVVINAYGAKALDQFPRLVDRPLGLQTRMVVIGNKAKLLVVQDGKTDDKIPVAEFQKVDGQWREELAPANANEAYVYNTETETRVETSIVDGFAKEVQAKTFATPDAAAAALSSRLETANNARFGTDGEAVRVGRWFMYGISVAKSPELAFSVFAWGADNGDPQAMVEVGLLYERGEGITKDPAAAVKQYKTAADRNNTEGMRRLAVCYQTGSGAAKDPANALELLQTAAKTDPEALSYLGDTYRDGLGVTADDAAALRYYTAAADQLKSGYAMLEAAACYERGKGVPKDPAKAFAWYTRAADAGNDDGMLRSAQCLEAGNGCAKDAKAARTWYEESAADGNKAAAAWLAAHPTR